jgi:hypothetical protein
MVSSLAAPETLAIAYPLPEAAIDPILYEPINNLIKQNFDKNIPYFVATWERANNHRVYADAACFVQNYYKYEQSGDPETREPIKSFQIYKISPEKRAGKFFSDQTTTALGSPVAGVKHHKTKYIGACNPNETKERGEKRYYMAIHYMEEAVKSANPQKCWKKATHWLNLAIEDKNLDARLRRVQWLENGANPNIMECYEQALEEMRQLAYEPRKSKVAALQLTKFLLEMLENTSPYEGQESEIDECSSRINRLEQALAIDAIPREVKEAMCVIAMCLIMDFLKMQNNKESYGR